MDSCKPKFECVPFLYVPYLLEICLTKGMLLSVLERSTGSHRSYLRAMTPCPCYVNETAYRCVSRGITSVYLPCNKQNGGGFLIAKVRGARVYGPINCSTALFTSRIIFIITLFSRVARWFRVK
jgi:hypothetical protein